MNKTNLAIIIYVIGIIIGMFVLDIWSAETSPKAILGMIWTALFAIALYYACLLYTSPSPRDTMSSRMPSSA